MKALIATDGSSYSFESIRQVSRMLSLERDQVVLYYSPPVVGATVVDLVVEQGQSALADLIFTEAINHLPEPWRPAVQKIVGSADVRADIVKSAEHTGANLIAVGARGLGAVARVLLGSVSRSVVHAAKVPVLVARVVQTCGENDVMRVLLACESAETGRQMAELLGQFCWRDGSSCEVLTVVPSVLGGSIPKWLAAPSRSAEMNDMIRVWVEEERNQLVAAQQEMQTVCQALPAPMKKSNAKVAQGHAATEIIDAAKNLKADLIVIGSKASTP